MNWIDDIRKSIEYIEDNLQNDITINKVASSINISPFYYQKMFILLCGISPSEYIRNRRLSLAGKEIQTTNKKIIDIAYLYGYESQDSFTKAFTRFHGINPSNARKQKAKLNYYLPLTLYFKINGGFDMDFKIVKKPSFTLVGYSKLIKFDEGYQECPKFWDYHFESGRGKNICGYYALCMDENVSEGHFKYMIADDYIPSKNYPDDVEMVVVKENIWGVFSCIGPLPNALQSVNTKIFNEWLPNNKEYAIAGGYNIEFYSDASKYEKGTSDEKYYSEIWIPLKEIKK